MLGGKSVGKLFCMFSAVAALALLGFMPEARTAAQSTGAVYVLSNQPDENAVIVFHRNANGVLEPGGRFSTGGSGIGSGPNPLGSQGSLILNADNRMLFAVNAGSDSITAFSVSGDVLKPLQTIPSGGTQPVSLTVWHDLLFVLNAGGATPNINGFRIVPEPQQAKTLVPLPGSTQALPTGSAAPAEVSFTPDGRNILVTEPGASQIVSFSVTSRGQASLANTVPATANGPFGLVFSQEFAITANTSNAAPQQGSMSSYRLMPSGGDLIPVSSSVMDNQTASTWAAVTGSGKIAFTTNTMSGTISSFAVSPHDGSLTLNQAAAATLQAQDGSSLFPAGMALSNDSRFLYVRNGANGTISGYLVRPDGSLTLVAQVTGLPDTAAGIAAR